MDTVTYLDQTDPMTQAITTFAIIDHGNNEFTSMLKSVYDAQQVTA